MGQERERSRAYLYTFTSRGNMRTRRPSPICSIDKRRASIVGIITTGSSAARDVDSTTIESQTYRRTWSMCCHESEQKHDMSGVLTGEWLQRVIHETPALQMVGLNKLHHGIRVSKTYSWKKRSLYEPEMSKCRTEHCLSRI